MEDGSATCHVEEGRGRIGSEGGDGPSRRSETDREHGQQPTVDLGVAGEDGEDSRPEEDEEDDDENRGRPDGNARVKPKELPVASVRRREPEVCRGNRAVSESEKLASKLR